MEKLDFKKKYKTLYNPPSKEVTFVEVPAFNFLMIDGEGNPNTSQEFQDAVQALYKFSYALKFMLKKAPEPFEYTVSALEGLWWADNMEEFSVFDKDSWKWTLLIMQPDPVTPELVAEARIQIEKKKKDENREALAKIRFEKFDEGYAAQIMHIGPYSAEAPNIQKIHDAIKANGYQLRGKHHEIYLGDPRKADQAKMKTVLRQPFSK